jgi:hypothetical protein
MGNAAGSERAPEFGKRTQWIAHIDERVAHGDAIDGSIRQRQFFAGQQRNRDTAG